MSSLVSSLLSTIKLVYLALIFKIFDTIFLSQGKMRIFELIGLLIYLVLIAILVARQIKVSSDFRNKKITEEKHQKLTKRNTILLIIVGILLILFLYTPFKILIF